MIRGSFYDGRPVTATCAGHGNDRKVHGTDPANHWTGQSPTARTATAPDWPAARPAIRSSEAPKEGLVKLMHKGPPLTASAVAHPRLDGGLCVRDWPSCCDNESDRRMKNPMPTVPLATDDGLLLCVLALGVKNKGQPCASLVSSQHVSSSHDINDLLTICASRVCALENEHQCRITRPWPLPQPQQRIPNSACPCGYCGQRVGEAKRPGT